MVSPRLGFPELANGQAAPETTVNEALRYVEQGAGHFTFADRDLAAPPGSPVDGGCYLVASGASGAWAGHSGDIAFYLSSAWAFIEAPTGATAWVVDEGLLIVHEGAGVWSDVAGGTGGGGGPSGSSGLQGTGGVLRWIEANGVSGGTTANGGVWGNNGAAGAPALATTNRLTRAVRHTRTTGAAAGASAGLYSLQAYTLDVGFTHEEYVGIEASVANYRLFIGARGASSITLAASDPSALTSILAFGLDAADANIQLMHNDAAGTATKNATTIARPGAGEMLFTHIDADPTTGDVYCYIAHYASANLTATPTTEWEDTLTAGVDLPAVAQLLTCGHQIGNGATAAAAQISMTRASIFSPF